MSKLELFINKANDIHNNKYDYSLVVFTNTDTKVEILCPIHGKFEQTPYHHINRGQGCPTCGRLKAAETKTSDLSTFILKAKQVHGNKYDYSKTIYKFAKEKVVITCPDHGDFEQLVSGHLSGYGCKHCASHGKGRVSMSDPCTLYYLYLPDLGYYKLGITSQSITNRYRTKFDTDQFVVVFTKTYSTGKEAYSLEQTLISSNQHLKYTGTTKILNSGNTELFVSDIFKGNYNEFITTP